MIPLLLDRGQSVRANISLDAGLLEAFDTEASRCSLTRSAFFVSAAMVKVVGVERATPRPARGSTGQGQDGPTA